MVVVNLSLLERLLADKVVKGVFLNIAKEGSLFSDPIDELDKQMKEFRKRSDYDGLPQEVFYLASRLTPLVNVDLLIKDENGRSLLSWRDDEFGNKGWHVPGGIVRVKEVLTDRVEKVSNIEIGCIVDYKPKPIAVNQIIRNRDNCCHYVSFLYDCFLSSDFTINNDSLSKMTPGFLKWHDNCPKDLISAHEIYKDFIDGL